MEEIIENVTKDTKNNVVELLNYIPQILKEKYKLEKELKELKQENKQLKKQGREVLAQIEEDEKNNISKEDEEYKSKTREANRLAKKVLGLGATISEKESLLKKINLALEVLDYNENLQEEYQKALESIHQKEKEREEKEEQRKKQEEIKIKTEDTKKEGRIEKIKKGIKNICKNVPKLFSNVKTGFKGITQKTRLYSAAKRVDLEETPVENKQVVVQNDEIEESPVIKENNSIQIQDKNTNFVEKIDNTDSHIEQNAIKKVQKKMSATDYIKNLQKAAEHIL